MTERVEAPALPSTQQIRFCASRDGTRIAYGTRGNGPPLVWVAHFVHHLNFDWDSPVWRPWILALAKRHTLIRYDFRGTGLSDRAGVEFTFEKLVEDFESVISASGVRNFAPLAMSGDARVVLPFAVQNPERITSLHIPDATAEQARSFNELLRLTTSAANAVALLRTLVESDMQDLLPNLRCPTLVFHSRRSAVLPFDEGRRVAALVPNARLCRSIAVITLSWAPSRPGSSSCLSWTSSFPISLTTGRPSHSMN